MLIKNAKVFVGKEFVDGDVRFGSTIEAVGTLEGAADYDAAGCYVIPGLVDIHTHGAMGEDFSDGNPAGMQPMADYYAAHGVTSFLATTMTLKEETLTPAMHTIRDFKRQGGAKCAGIHLEGPFLCYAKRGAQAAENLHKPDADLFDRLNAASGGMVKLVTVACEEEGAEASAAEIQEIAGLIAEYDIPAIFTEVNGSDATANAVSRETGVRVAQLTMLMSAEAVPADSAAPYRAGLEQQLAGLIAQVEGAGETTVMVTLESGEERIYATDTQTGTEQSRQTHVLLEDGTALEETTYLPTVCGVAVVCDGGGDVGVEARITALVSALLDVPANRICVEQRSH